MNGTGKQVEGKTKILQKLKPEKLFILPSPINHAPSLLNQVDIFTKELVMMEHRESLIAAELRHRQKSELMTGCICLIVRK